MDIFFAMCSYIFELIRDFRSGWKLHKVVFYHVLTARYLYKLILRMNIDMSFSLFFSADVSPILNFRMQIQFIMRFSSSYSFAHLTHIVGSLSHGFIEQALLILTRNFMLCVQMVQLVQKLELGLLMIYHWHMSR